MKIILSMFLFLGSLFASNLVILESNLDKEVGFKINEEGVSSLELELEFDNNCLLKETFSPNNINLENMRLEFKNTKLFCANDVEISIAVIGPDKKSNLPVYFNSEKSMFLLKSGKIVGISNEGDKL